jgi:hypothetical protein
MGIDIFFGAASNALFVSSYNSNLVDALSRMSWGMPLLFFQICQ